jgi:hypothetical protein
MFGNAPLMHSLAGIAGLGKAPTGAALIAKKLKGLPPDAREKVQAAQKAHKEAMAKLRSGHATTLDEIFAAYRASLPVKASPAELKAARRVIGNFLLMEYDTAPGIESNSTELVVNGKVIASRPSAIAQYMKVCPGEFGNDKASRRAANALLDLLGSGVRVNDHDGKAFIAAGRSTGGRVVSPDACLTVQVNKNLRKAANKAVNEAVRDIGRGAVYNEMQETLPFEPSAEAKAYDKRRAAQKNAEAYAKDLFKKRRAKSSGKKSSAKKSTRKSSKK